MTNNNQLPAVAENIVENSLPVIKKGGEILLAHRTSVARAVDALTALIQRAEGIPIPEVDDMDAVTFYTEEMGKIDQELQNVIVKCSKTVEKLNTARAPITQMCNLIIKAFTTEENKLDPKNAGSPVARAVQIRNGYARMLLEIQKKREAIIAEKTARAKEESDLRIYIKNQIAAHLLSYLNQRKHALNESFNAITLENFEEKERKLNAMNAGIPMEKLKELMATVPATLGQFLMLSTDEVLKIRYQEIAGYDIVSFASEYQRQIAEQKQYLIDRLPSKKAELEEIKRAKDLADATALALAEKEREEREKAEKDRLDREAAEQASKLKEETARQQLAGQASVLFEQTVETANGLSTSPMPETRQGYDIVVLHPAGWVEIFQFWWTREGIKLTNEEIGKKSLNQMKTYAEGVAKKTSEKISSKYIQYDVEVKSINRKQKAV